MQMPVWQDDVHSEQHVQHEAPLLQESEKRQISSSPAVVSSSSVADEEAAMRKIFTGSHLAAHLAELTRNGQLPTKHCSNEIKTSKYSIIPLSPNFFLYKNLFEQFQRAANVYFLFIAILQLIPGVSPTGRFTTIIPLSFVMFVSLLKDVWEDYKRHMLDGALNNSDACAFRRGEWTTIAWKEVEVGDLLMIEKSLPFPADMVMLSSTEPDGLCYIETSSLDGETNLKIRKSCAASYEVFNPEAPNEFSSIITHEQPNNRIENFSGNIVIAGKKTPLTTECILLRGAALRNTKAAFGIVIFTGQETKLMKNSSAKRHKMSNMDHITNKQVLYIFGFQVCLCFMCSLGLGFYTASLRTHWYLDYSNVNVGAVASLGFLTFLILFNNLIPISLYVSMEMVKLVQALLINSDAEMYYAFNDTPALSRTSSLNEELGQVEYVFSDKTGTLTCNIMDFVKFCAISADGKSAVSYGQGVTEIAKAAALREKRILVDPRPASYKPKDGFCFYDDRILDGKWKTLPNVRQIEEFLAHLAVCHTVVAEYSETDKNAPAAYQAASPDETCLVKGARELGSVFINRTEKDVEIEILGVPMRYQILDIIEFDSTRKRMSVVVRDPNGKLQLLTKGADSVIFERLRKDHTNKALLDETLAFLTDFAAEGLRTLVIAKADIDQAYYDDWAARYREAQCAVVERAERVAAVGGEIEKDLEVLGATAIEDKLQDAVPQTIELLIAAGVKVWVLTGDKQETAINIGFACALLNNSMNVMLFDSETVLTIRDKLIELRDRATLDRLTETAADLGLVIQGSPLLHAILEDSDLSKIFLSLATMCKSIICCRVSPLQKAQVVSLVKDNTGAITLSIGDGANDVSMIQSANVGIGISGLEGLQAARASDYSIAQFRFLQRLLLVHGRWSYRRISRLILYSFYKNITLYLTQLWFCFFNAFSGQTITDQWALALYNVWFTAFPIMFLAVLDRDIDAQRILSMTQFPELYRDGLGGRLFNTPTFWKYISNAFLHSALSFFVPIVCIYGLGAGNSAEMDLGSLGVLSYSLTLGIVTGKVALETLSWTLPNFLIIIGSIALWFAFLFAYTNLYSAFQVTDFANWYGVADQVVPQAVYWLIIIIGISLALTRDVLWKVYRRNFAPELSHVIQVLEERKGAFTRAIIPLPYQGLLMKLETLDPKEHSMKFVPGSHLTGYGFAQEGGQRDFIKVFTTAAKKVRETFSGTSRRSVATRSQRTTTMATNVATGNPSQNWSHSSYTTSAAIFFEPPEEMTHIDGADI